MKHRLQFFFVVVFFFLVNVSQAVPTNNFAQSLELSRAGNFPEAATAFQTLLKTQISDGALLDLGIVEWQRGHAGAAILAWEQARWLDPFDERTTTNLKFARQIAQVDTPELKWFEQASTWLPANWWVWLAGASLWLAVGATVLPGIFRRRKTGWQQSLTALGLGLFLLSLTVNYGVVSRTQLGFVLKQDAPLQLTPTSAGEVIATLTSGEPARLVRTHGNYLLIRTPGATGWILQAQFGLINPP
jgi:hypothetical protein